MIKPDGRLTGGHYSHAVRAGEFIFVAGQTPRDASRRIIGGTISEQGAAALENVRTVLAEADSRLEQIVKVTVYLQDLSDAQAFNEVYKNYFPTFMPARTTVGCQLNGVLVEIDAVAFVGGDN